MTTQLQTTDFSNSLIMVEAPYNKLYDLDFNADKLHAKVDNEYIIPLEGGPIAVAEAGRHIAILGSIKLAHDYNFGEKCYFLATKAKLTRESSKISDSPHLSLEVETLYKDKRNGEIGGSIYDSDKQLLFSVNIGYNVLRKNIFERLYKNYRQPNCPTLDESPYINRKSLVNLKVGSQEAFGEYETIMPCECEGHFKNYPALPVAIVGNLFIELGMKLFQKCTDGQFSKIVARKTSMAAQKLAFAGESISFTARIKSMNSPASITIVTEALVGDETISNAEFELLGLI